MSEEYMHMHPGAHVHFGADFEVHAVRRRGRVVDGLCAGFNISIDAVVVRCRKETHVAETVNGDGVIWCTITDSGGIAGDGSVVDIVVGLSTQKDAVSSKNNVARDIRTLKRGETDRNSVQTSPNKMVEKFDARGKGRGWLVRDIQAA